MQNWLLVETNQRGVLMHCGETGEVRNLRQSCLQLQMCVDYSPAPLQTVTQLFVDLPSCNEKHSAMATPWVQLAFWFIEIHCWSLLSHQLRAESQTDTSQFLSLLSLYLVSSHCQTFFLASSVAKGEVIYPAKPQLTADTWAQTSLHW